MSFNIFKVCVSRSSDQRYSISKGVLRNFAKFTGKHLCQSVLIKLQASASVFQSRKKCYHRLKNIRIFSKNKNKSLKKIINNDGLTIEPCRYKGPNTNFHLERRGLGGHIFLLNVPTVVALTDLKKFLPFGTGEQKI